MPSERRVPVRREPLSLADSEFSSIRNRYEQEMRRMEDEMDRFRSRLKERERDFFERPALTSHRDRHDIWNDMKSPLVNSTDDGKTLKLKFDVTQYEPEEIVVKTIDNRLLVHAKHEEKSEGREVFREYNREFMLPSGVDPWLIKSSLSRDGVLSVEAPLPAKLEYPNERRIPIMEY
ncbi:heat shock protein beta-6-like [Brevipalpus obovatus]|uniref:heat shock protein beta-6-like n=1 Tax=Brevipalpus obovatus TaxID=246614 RepID=UPI003D9F96EF